jgi:uncharacterized protein
MMTQNAIIAAKQRFIGIVCASVLALAAPVMAADLQRGVVKYQAGDYDGALAEWRPLAEKNDPNALFNIGQSYRLGRGVKEDMAIALQFYEKAGALGHVAAQGNAGTLLYFSNPPVQNKPEAINWWQRAATNGDPRSQYMLGVLHFNGEGLPKDWPRAYALTVQARDAGLPEASKALTKMDEFLSPQDKSAGIALSSQYKTAQSSGRPMIATDDNRAVNPGVREDIARPTRAAADPTPAPVIVPPAPVKKMPAPKAAMAAPLSGAGWRVQLGAFANTEAAQRAWSIFSGNNSALADVTPSYPATSTGGARLQAGNFESRSGADTLCGKLKVSNIACFVVKGQ